MVASRGNTWAKATGLIAACALVAVVIALQSGARARNRRALATLDAQIMRLVLKEVRTQNGHVLFDTTPLKHVESVEKVLDRHEPEPWSRLTPDELKYADAAAARLVERTMAGDHLREFEAPGDGIQIMRKGPADAEESYDRSARARAVRAWPPGYANHDNFAVVRLVVPWSIHHAEWTYLLARVDGQWTVCLRQIVYHF